MQETRSSKILRRTYEIRKAAVKANGMLIAEIPPSSRTDELCDLAVNENGLAIQFVPQTRERILNAMKTDADSIKFINKKQIDFEVLMAAASSKKSIGKSLKYYFEVGDFTVYILDKEIERLKSVSGVNPSTITRDGLLSKLYLRAMTSDGSNLDLVPVEFQTEEVCWAAVYRGNDDENEPYNEVLCFVKDRFFKAALTEAINEREAEREAQKCVAKESPSM